MWCVRTGVMTALAVGAALAASCSSKSHDAAPATSLASRDTMLDPSFCGACHRDQYNEWSASMHAQAADDPVFKGLDAQMQREVAPEQRAFCLKCHAPMAVRLGVPLDQASLDARPEVKGVTCFFCHAATGASGMSNNPLTLDEDNVMGAAIKDPIDPVVHKATYRGVLDGKSDAQSGMCGPCHDIDALGGAHIERTFKEWTRSRFAFGSDLRTCASCHMPGRDGQAANVPNAPPRTIHDHGMVGVDLTLQPGKDTQRDKVQAFLDTAIDAQLCVQPAPSNGWVVDVALTNSRVGHGWPSGSAQDRRAWIELTAYQGANVLLQSGHVPDDVAVKDVTDPLLFLLRDHDYDAQGKEIELFWRAASFDGKQVPASSPPGDGTPDGNVVHATYNLSAAPDRVTSALHVRPIDHDIVATAAQAGDLDPNSLPPLTTFTLGPSQLEWTASAGKRCVP